MKKIMINLKDWLNLEDNKKFADGIKGLSIVVFPALPYLYIYNDINSIELGVQEISIYNSGAYTGCVSMEHLKDFSISYAIINHRENKVLEDELFLKKMQVSLDNNVKNVICFDSENELARILNLLRNENYKNLCFAYEPNEEISTGNLIEQIDKFNEKLKVAYSNDYELLYGGNISSQNIEDFNKNLKVDGFLISRHALSIDELKTMIYLVNE